MTPRRGWRSLPVLQPLKGRVIRLQKIYWKYLRPLYCEVVPTPAASRVLVVAPHIDDDVIGCGGVLRQHVLAGAAVTSVYLVDGGPIREAEAHEAAKLIGISELIFLRWPKGTVNVREHTIAGLQRVTKSVRPEVVYSPFFLDPHPDHAVATDLLDVVANRDSTIQNCYLYEVWSPLVPNALIDMTAQAELKRQAINAHRSQVETINMSAGVLGLNTYRAEMNRVAGFAEAFLRLTPRELSQILHDRDRGVGTGA